ncbi:cadherin domain-containing protein, partial [Shinella sp.]|uniref:cadherin domain-containing protein n=1 Tax=Shinella sp. TaxID=1870904 RepID=UPI004035B37E
MLINFGFFGVLGSAFGADGGGNATPKHNRGQKRRVKLSLHEAEFAFSEHDSISTGADLKFRTAIDRKMQSLNAAEAAMATINGTAGNDNLIGTAADDIINGMAGDDTLYGGDGVDTYLFSAGWGKDVIDNLDFSNSFDSIVFDATVAVTDIAISWSVNRDLILTNIHTQDQITVTSYDNPNATIDEIKFADGTVFRPPVITSNGGAREAELEIAENIKTVSTITERHSRPVTITLIDGYEDTSLFELNATTGAISFKNAPDFENPSDFLKQNVYRLGAMVEDGFGFRDYQYFYIVVTDANEAPVINSNGGGNSASVNVAENKTAVLTAAATDQDNSTTTWSISGGADKALFQIDATTGALSFKSAPDFEAAKDNGKNNVYDVTIKVTDAGGLSDTQAIAVKVTNVNDAPVISSKGTGTIVAVMAENGKAVTTVKAADPEKTAITWSISGGADKALFQIDAKTGVVSFKSAPDFEVPKDSDKDNIYDVMVKATDAAGLSDTEWLAVVVTNVNDAPVISSNGGGSKASINVAENGKAVTTAKGADPEKTALTWSISGGADKALFQINAVTGALTFKSAQDFETAKDSGNNNVYDVTIKATDATGLSDTQALAVTVTNVNETPVITSNGGGAKAAITIAENGKAVTTARATDPDKTAVTWSISGGADKALFQIDAKTGVVSFKSAPDFETPTDVGENNVYDVTIKATDAGGLSDTQALAVRITNVNDAPVISSNGGGRQAVVNAAENAKAVTTVRGMDPEKTALTWSISGGADKALFQIDAKTGVVTFKSAPDFETPTDVGKNNVYDVKVKVTDATGLSDTQALAVT